MLSNPNSWLIIWHFIPSSTESDRTRSITPQSPELTFKLSTNPQKSQQLLLRASVQDVSLKQCLLQDRSQQEGTAHIPTDIKQSVHTQFSSWMQQLKWFFPLLLRRKQHFSSWICIQVLSHISPGLKTWATVGKALFQPVVNLNYLESPPVEQTELSALSEVPR